MRLWSLLLPLLLAGCVTTVYTVAPSCPEPTEEGDAQLGNMLDLAAIHNMDTYAFRRDLGDQEKYCAHISAKVDGECHGNRLGCAWWRLWNE